MIDKTKMVEYFDKRIRKLPEDWHTAMAEIKTIRRKINSGEFDCEKKGNLEFTDFEIDSACMSYRHDFGLMPEHEKELHRHLAKEWLLAFKKAKEFDFGAVKSEWVPKRSDNIKKFCCKLELCGDMLHRLVDEPFNREKQKDEDTFQKWMKKFRK